MAKTLVSVDNVGDFVCRAENRIFVDGTIILTPGAKDELARRGTRVVHGPCPDAATCTLHGGAGNQTLDGLMQGLTAMLRSQYGVSDPDRLKALSLEAVRIIRDNL